MRKGEHLLKLKKAENFQESPGIFLKQADGKPGERSSCKLPARHFLCPSKNIMSKNILLICLFLTLFTVPGNEKEREERGGC